MQKGGGGGRSLSAGTFAARFKIRFKIVFVDDVENSKTSYILFLYKTNHFVFCLDEQKYKWQTIYFKMSLSFSEIEMPRRSFEGFRKNVEIFQKFCDWFHAVFFKTLKQTAKGGRGGGDFQTDLLHRVLKTRFGQNKNQKQKGGERGAKVGPFESLF